ncbi:hypothetical protein [Aliiglaciecola sp. M165]|uniref:hypothetical protein n=1 Tax=Aliiglaciecola sp. M165 TaxID=2593649 RepID=UPI00117CA8EB|nr:hypothetical protein [Aliiglaciecola sp. M165]TRY30331.1 hypothetical protein FM019_16095 [Aliiglaciecola sp. M165]
MAIRRSEGISNSSTEESATHAPSSAVAQDYDQGHRTGDLRQIQSEYRSNAQSKKAEGLDTGALLPKDMTVKLVRAEAANWETLLQCLFSVTLTLFGLFLGAWVSSTNDDVSFTSLEVVATLSFGVLSFGLIFIWVILKIRQSKHGIKVPYDILSQFSEGGTEQGPPKDS